MVKKILLSILILVVIALIAGGVLVGVANAAAPGDALYGLDRGLENLRANLTTDPQSKARLETDLAQERLEEIRALAARGDHGQLELVIQDYRKPAQETETPIESPKEAPKSGPDPDDDDDASAYCDGKKTKHHPTGDKLAARYGVAYEEIMTWACAGYGFGEVDLAYEIAASAGAPVTEIFAKRASNVGWGEIMMAYGFKDKSLEEKPEDGQNEIDDGAFCDGRADKNHPTGEKLAERYAVSYEEIMAWFCAGHGFGDIDAAYQISEIAGAPVTAIFARRAGGAGWGEIKQEFGLIGKDKLPKEKGKDKDNDRGNSKKD